MREMVKLLVENGAHINTYTDDFDSPLYEAVTLRRHPQVIQYLIEQGVEENDGEHNRVVLSEFFDYNKQGQRCSKTLELLLAAGCDPNLPFESGNFALNQAVADRDLGIIRQLLEAGADLENRAFDVTPLYLAAYRSRPEVFKLLKSLGADMAADTRCNPLVTFLDGTLDETLTLALLLEDYKDQINVPAYDSGTALVVAAQPGYLDGVKVLLELGADPHMVPLNQGQEQTALSSLVSFEHLFSGLYDRTLTNYKVLCAEELIKHGALATLPKGCGLHLVQLILCDERELLQLFLRHTMGPLCVDSVDVTTERIQVFTHVNNTALGRCLSPLAAALLRGSLSIARFLANKWFLAKADLVGCELLGILRAVLDNAYKFDSVEFLDEYTSQPMSLLQMSFVVVSSQLGKGGGCGQVARRE